MLKWWVDEVSENHINADFSRNYKYNKIFLSTNTLSDCLLGANTYELEKYYQILDILKFLVSLFTSSKITLIKELKCFFNCLYLAL